MESSTGLSLTEQIETVAFHNPHLNVRKMRFAARGSEVVINGQVESFFEKQMAQETVKRIDGVQTVINQLEVTWS